MAVAASGLGSLVDKVVAAELEEVGTGEDTELGDMMEERAAGEVVAGEVTELGDRMEETAAGEVEELVTGDANEVEELVAGLEGAELGNGLDERADYRIMIRKKMAAMRKEQIKAMEGGWMRFASCGKKGSLRCAACYMTTYCGLECHEKHWGEGHRGRCRQVRKEFVEVVLDPAEKDRAEGPLLYFTVVVTVRSLDSYICIYNKDDSVAGFLDRQGQEEAYDELRKEQGLVQETDETGQKAGTFEKFSTACFFAHYKGKTEDGDIRLKINVKRVQPMVLHHW